MWSQLVVASRFWKSSKLFIHWTVQNISGEHGVQGKKRREKTYSLKIMYFIRYVLVVPFLRICTRKSITETNGDQWKILPGTREKTLREKGENHLMSVIIVVINCFRSLLLFCFPQTDDFEYMTKWAHIHTRWMNTVCSQSNLNRKYRITRASHTK